MVDLKGILSLILEPVGLESRGRRTSSLMYVHVDDIVYEMIYCSAAVDGDSITTRNDSFLASSGDGSEVRGCSPGRICHDCSLACSVYVCILKLAFNRTYARESYVLDSPEESRDRISG